MDVDVPVFTQVNKAYTETDKQQHRIAGRCFQCSRQGHMAKDCPMRKTSATQFKPRSFQSKPRYGNQIPRKTNQWKKRSFQKPLKFGQSAARTATIEEVESDNEDNEDVPALAARAAKFNEGQREQWVEEMKALGINF